MRKRSATSSLPPTQSEKKPRNVTGPAALLNLSESVDRFGSIFQSALVGSSALVPTPSVSVSVPALPALDSSPARKQTAMQHLQRTQDWLSVQEKLRMVKLFQKDKDAALAYMSLESEELSKLWITDMLYGLD